MVVSIVEKGICFVVLKLFVFCVFKQCIALTIVILFGAFLCLYFYSTLEYKAMF